MDSIGHRTPTHLFGRGQDVYVYSLVVVVGGVMYQWGYLFVKGCSCMFEQIDEVNFVTMI